MNLKKPVALAIVPDYMTSHLRHTGQQSSFNVLTASNPSDAEVVHATDIRSNALYGSLEVVILVGTEAVGVINKALELGRVNAEDFSRAQKVYVPLDRDPTGNGLAGFLEKYQVQVTYPLKQHNSQALNARVTTSLGGYRPLLKTPAQNLQTPPEAHYG